MGTDITTRQAIPSPTPQHDKSLSPQGLQDHRARIAFDVRTVLSAYFQPHEAEEIKSAQLAWWCDELQEWTQEQVVWALRQWNRKNPRLRPTPGDIVTLCKVARGKKFAATIPQHQPTPEPREVVSKERAAELLAEAGFAPKRMQADV
jgi:hypothetical protein